MSINPYAAPAAAIPDAAPPSIRPFMLGSALALIGLRSAALMILPGGGDVPEGLHATICALLVTAASGAIGLWLGFQLETEGSLLRRSSGLPILLVLGAELLWFVVWFVVLGSNYDYNAAWMVPSFVVVACAASRTAPLWVERVWTPTSLWLVEGAALGMPIRTHHDPLLIGGRAWSHIPVGAPHGIVDTPLMLAAAAVIIALVLVMRSLRVLVGAAEMERSRGWAVVSALVNGATLVGAFVLLLQRVAENG